MYLISVVPRDSLNQNLKIIPFFFFSGKGGGQEGGGKPEKSLNDFAAEYAKSNRSTCKGCEQKIEKVNIW